MITISIPRPILRGIFDECDRYSSEETGGRLLGFYTLQDADLHISVKALIGAGPNAQRTRVSFFQDGEYQERIFRAVEQKHIQIEHLGNWHSHHVNGLKRLSQGDCETYRKCVNSPNHNTDFFYALLITHATPSERVRYAIRHFVFIRGSEEFAEIPKQYVDTTGSKILEL